MTAETTSFAGPMRAGSQLFPPSSGLLLTISAMFFWQRVCREQLHLAAVLMHVRGGGEYGECAATNRDLVRMVAMSNCIAL
jgi:hypothetical protein